MYSRKLLLILFFLVSLDNVLFGQVYQHLIVSSGFNQDVIVNGQGPAVSSSTAGVDSTGIILANCLMANNFQPTAAPPPAYALPMSGVINSAVTAGLSYQLGSYSVSNSLWLRGIASGTIEFENLQMATRLYILTTSGHGASNCSGIIYFTDNTTQNFGSFTVPDWFNGNTLPVAASGMGRVLRGTNAIENPLGNPRLYQYQINILPQNYQKEVQSIQFNKTNSLAVLNIFAVTAQLSPCLDIELFEADFELCPGADSTLIPNIDNGVTYTWNDGSVQSSLNISAPGTYWATVQTTQCTFSDTITVTLPYLISPFSLGQDLVLCTDETQILMPDVIQDGEYLWSDGSSENFITVSGEGLFWLQMSDGCGSYTDSLVTSVLPNPMPFSLGADVAICQGESIELTTTPQTDMSYLWQNGSNQVAISVSNAGTYWLRIFNDCGMFVDSILVSIPANPVAVLPMDTVLCNDATLILNPLLMNNSGLFWQDGSISSSFTITQPGTYAINAYNQCDTVSDAITVSYLNTPIVQLGNDLTLCEGESRLITAYGNGDNYIWFDGSFGGNYNVSYEGVYWAMAANVCGIVYDTIVVKYVLKPVVDFGEDRLLCFGEKILLHANNPLALYQWNDGITDDNRMVSEEGEYALTAINQCGVVSDTIYVAYQDCSCSFFIPNSFTPNNDGLNDFFMPIQDCQLAFYCFQVFNQWGQLIFETYETNLPWDGAHLFGDHYVQDGVYIYRVVYRDINSVESIAKTGSVVVMR